jgi:hypothetical protein
MLESLAEELVTAAGDGTLPETLSADQVWLDSDGSVLLLDAASSGEAASSGVRLLAPSSSPEVAGSNFDREPGVRRLAELAVLALEGAPRPGAGRVRALLPRHAAVLLGRLFGGAEPMRSAADLRSALAATRDRPTEVTRVRRATHVAVLVVLLTMCSGSCTMNTWWFGHPTGAFSLFARSRLLSECELTLQDLEAAEARAIVADAFNPQPLLRPAVFYVLAADFDLRDRLAKRIEANRRALQARLEATTWLDRRLYEWMVPLQKQIAERGRAAQVAAIGKPLDPRASAQKLGKEDEFGQDHPAASAIALISVALPPFVLVLWALLFRGGLTFVFMGLRLVRRDGRPAGHFRSAWRALLAWGPPTLLTIAAIALDLWYWSLAAPESQPVWVPWLAGACRWTAPVLVLTYPVLAIAYPRRTLHDWLAGTYIVPS